MKKPLEKVFVRPAPGCKVRKGLHQEFLKAAGETVELTIYWRRRILMKDVIKGKATLEQSATGRPSKTDAPTKAAAGKAAKNTSSTETGAKQ